MSSAPPRPILCQNRGGRVLDPPGPLLGSAGAGMSHIVPERILIVRLDRIGDVVLSTPVIQVLRTAYPQAFIAMMVRSECQDLVMGNPALNQVIIYEKGRGYRGIRETIRFAWRLRRSKFNVALVLHPTYRSHWIVRLAGIPVRIGYQRKGGRLLTHRLPHRKQEGRRHEADYTLDLVRFMGLHPPAPHPVVPVRPEAERRVSALLEKLGLSASEPLVVLHPSASCPSKRWLPQRFAEVADRLIDTTGHRMILVAGPGDLRYANEVEQAMRCRAVNLAGMLSIAELACVLKRCRLLISNDSGPVHVAAALGTPVVTIFGRNQPGLSQGRWGPLGEGHVILQKDVGCVTCLAHKCDIGFLCLTSLSSEEVYQAAVNVLARCRT